MATLQPALARSSAMARPMRRAAPVISTVLAVEVIRFMGPGRGIEVVSAVRTPETGRTYHAALQSDATLLPCPSFYQMLLLRLTLGINSCSFQSQTRKIKASYPGDVARR